MADNKHPDSYWRKKLSRKAYEALRLGRNEKPNEGKYANSKQSGIYVCAGCNSKLFDSSDKCDDDSGFASFCFFSKNKNVLFDDDGFENNKRITRVICSSCGGVLGFVPGEITEKTEEVVKGMGCDDVVYLNSSSIFLKKRLTPLNYPLLYIFIFSFLAVGVLYMWALAEGKVFNETKYEETNSTLHVYVGGKDIMASVVRIDNLNPQEQSVVFGREAIFIIFSKDENSPRLKLPKRKLDVLWLDSNYKIISFKRGNGEKEDNILTPLDNAVFALVIQPGELPESSAREGDTVKIVDKNGLL